MSKDHQNENMTDKEAQMEQAMRASELSFRRLFESARDGILILDVETGRIADVNPFLIELLGFSKSEIIGKTVGELSPFKDIVLHDRMLERLQRDGYVRHEHLPLETKDGSKVEAEFVSNVYQAGDHKVIQCNVRDITERKRTEEALAKSGERINGLIASALDAIISIDSQQRIVLFNPAAEGMFGVSAAEAMGTNLGRFIPVRFRDEHPGLVRKFGATEEINKHMRGVRGVSGLRANGEEFSIEASISQVEVSGEKLFTVILRDITERKRAEEELRASREQLRQLAARIQVVREEERTHAAREIHDVLAQELTGLKMEVEWMQRRLAMPMASWKQNALREKLDGMIGLITTASHSVQRIASGLRPVVLDSLGLSAALQWVALDFQKRTEITCRANVPAEALALDEARSTGLFRILQESLTNVALHAQATAVEICLSIEGDEVLLTVADNGRGIQPQDVGDTKSMGLLGMRERASLHGGTCTITGRPGGGTEVEARLPLRKNPEPSKPV